jgi:hypothetical protein
VSSRSVDRHLPDRHDSAVFFMLPFFQVYATGMAGELTMRFLKRGARHLSTLLIFLLFASPVLNGRASLAAQQQRGKVDIVSPPAGFDFSKEDSERVALFRAQFMIRLHGILVSNYYEVLQNAVTDWGTAITMYETMAEDSQTLSLPTSIAPPENVANHLFTAFHDYFQRKATLCSEASRENLSPYMAKGLFNTLVKQADGFYFPKKDLPTFNAWKRKGTDVELTFRAKLEEAKREWSAVDQSDLIAVHENIGNDIPFAMPLNEFGDERNYIYATLLKDTDVAPALQLWYHVNFWNVAAKSWGAIIGPAAENELFLLSQINDVRSIAFTSAFLDGLIDCAGESLKTTREKQYVEIKDFHDAIYNKILEHRSALDELVNGPDFKKLLAAPLTPTFADALARLLLTARTYVASREKIAEYALKLKNIATLALQKFRQAGRRSMDKDITDLYEKYKKLFLAMKDRKNASSPMLSGGPCSAAQKGSDLSADSGTSTVDDLSGDQDPQTDAAAGTGGQKPDEEYQVDISTQFKSDLSINPGDTVNISAAGAISVGFLAGESTPDGIVGFSEYSYLPRFPHGSLLVRIGANSGWQGCGSGCTIQSPIRGNLEFLVNDRDFANNVGSYQVSIVISRARSRQK